MIVIMVQYCKLSVVFCVSIISFVCIVFLPSNTKGGPIPSNTRVLSRPKKKLGPTDTSSSILLLLLVFASLCACC